MAKKGVIYIFTTAVKGLIKIGKTDTNQLKERRRNLEQNGYWNVCGLKLYYAIEVSNKDECEKEIHDAFDRARVDKSELFAINEETAKNLLKHFEGKQIYPEVKENAIKTKKEEITTSPIVKSKQLTFEMLDIPIGSELIFVGNKNKPFNLVVKTSDNTNKITYQDKKYTLSGFATEKLGGPQQGGKYFTYNGELLTDVRKRLNK